jgi:hypothetical protein
VNRLKPSHVSGAFVAAGLLTAAVTASASDALNPALERLVVDQRCHATNVGSGGYGDYVSGVGSGQPNALGRFNDDPATLGALEQVTGRRACTPDNAAFMRLVNQWGFALAPTAMHTARTLGFGGFQFSLEAVYTKIDASADYWKLGSQGDRDPNSNRGAPYNNDVPGLIQQYSARVRKGFGFGLELAGQFGFVPNTSMLTGGADVRFALLEGFRTGALGIFPDVAVGAGVRTTTGTPALQLTTVGLDVQLSKPLVLADQSALSPRIGYQYLWIYGNSGVTDTTPATDALGYCGYSGTNVPGNPDPRKSSLDGQPVCAGGQPTDFNNNVVFSDVRLQRHRMIFGADYRYEFLSFGVQFITDIVDPSAAQSGDDTTTVVYVRDSNNRVVERRMTDKEILEGSPRQWSLVFQAGAQF